MFNLMKMSLVVLPPLMLTACAHTDIRGEGTRHERVVVGNVRIHGEDHVLTILPGSEVAKLSIVGDGNYVRVLEGGTIDKVEILGEDNEVVVPHGMVVEYSEIGEDNRLKYANNHVTTTSDE